MPFTSLQDVAQCTAEVSAIQIVLQQLIPASESQLAFMAQARLQNKLTQPALDMAIARFHHLYRLSQHQGIAHPCSLLREVSPSLFDLNSFFNHAIKAGHHEPSLEKAYDALILFYQRYGFSERSVLLQTPTHPDPYVDTLPLFRHLMPEYYYPLTPYIGRVLHQHFSSSNIDEHYATIDNERLADELYPIFVNAIKTKRAVPVESDECLHGERQYQLHSTPVIEH